MPAGAPKAPAQLIVTDLPNQVVNCAGREESIEAAEKSQLCAAFEGKNFPINTSSEPNRDERARKVGCKEEVGDIWRSATSAVTAAPKRTADLTGRFIFGRGSAAVGRLSSQRQNSQIRKRTNYFLRV